MSDASKVYPVAGRIFNFMRPGGDRYDGPCLLLGFNGAEYLCVIPSGESFMISLAAVRLTIPPKWKRMMGETVLASTGEGAE